MVHSPSLVSRQGCSRDAPLLIVGRVSGGRAKRLLPRRSKGGRGDAVAFASASQRPPPRRNRMAMAIDLRRRRAGHHQHREQSSPPKPQPRVAAGPAILAAESEISSDSIRVVDSAVAFLEKSISAIYYAVLSESVAHGRKNIRRSRSCKERNEAQKKMISGRSGFIGDEAKRFAGPFVTIAAEPD